MFRFRFYLFLIGNAFFYLNKYIVIFGFMIRMFCLAQGAFVFDAYVSFNSLSWSICFA